MAPREARVIGDARTIPADRVIGTDVCIIGGGPAGITLAREMVGRAWRVALLESGDLDVRAEAQTLNGAVSRGDPYRDLDASRVRALGGTTHVWGGWSRPLDACDFEEREWVPHSGWPFPRSHLDHAYARAHAICGLDGPDGLDAHAHDAYDIARLEEGTGTRPSLAGDPDVDEILFRIVPTRFGAAHLPALRSAANVEVMLHANALGLAMDAAGSTARGVRVASVAGNRFVVEARIVVLAAGGLENPRLLLASAGHGAQGVGNAHDLVGRFFADHLHVPVGTLWPESMTVGHRYQVRRVRGAAVRLGLSLTEAARRNHRLLGSAVTLHNADDPHDVQRPGPATSGYRSLMHIARAIRRGRYPDELPRHLATALRRADETLVLSYRRLRRPPPARLTIGIRAEQAPNRDSRVTLDETTDRFGVRRVRVDWRITDQDLDSLSAAQRLIARSLAAARVEMLPRDGEGGWRDALAPGAHHLGTTRMHRDPSMGVVDEHCRVHGTSNVYVAGGSVFPTGGWAPPTLTILALAVRLADHLATRVR
jgi:choline dehydrogenase-like flavoprotein